MKKKKVKILIAENSDLIREGLSVLLLDKNSANFSVEHCNGDCDIQHSIRKVAPRILIASPDIFLQHAKEINTLKEKFGLFSVGLVYSFHQPDSLKEFDGLIYLNDKAAKIQSTINELLQSYGSASSASSNETLTGREKEILKLLVNGNTTKQIATTLHLSTHTVNAHRRNIMRKLDIKTVSGLTIYAVLNNIISLKEA